MSKVRRQDKSVKPRFCISVRNTRERCKMYATFLLGYFSFGPKQVQTEFEKFSVIPKIHIHK